MPIEEGEEFKVSIGGGKRIRVRLVRYISDTEAEVEILSGPRKGMRTVIQKVKP